MKKICGVLPMVALAALVGCQGEGDLPATADTSTSDVVAETVVGEETPSESAAAVTFVSLKVPNMT